MVLTKEIIERGIRDCRAVSCADLHRGSCNLKFLQQFFNGCRSLYKLYLVVHFLPAFVFKAKRFRRNFFGELFRTLMAFMRSMIFAGLFPAFSRRIMCWVTEFYGFEGRVLGIASGIGALSLLFESKGRQSQITLYVTTKTIEIVYGYMKRHRLITRDVPNLSVFMFGFVMAVYGFFYQNEPSSIKHNYLSGLTKILGAV